MKIVPTIGRQIWYWQNKQVMDDKSQPYAATVCFVHGEGRLVNIAYYDHNGRPGIMTSCRLMQEGESDYPEGGFCTWMPYQIGQARTQQTPAKPT